MTVPCGQCIGCRLDKSNDWATRIIHETQMHQDNCFLTLTYNDEHLPSDQSLDLRHWQLFLKKLREKISPLKIRFYHCGEYGEDQTLKAHKVKALGRPHYHAIIFGYNFPDQKFHGTTPGGSKIFISKELTKLWGKGHASIGTVTLASAKYVARYCMKKINGDRAENHYVKMLPNRKLPYRVKPEYTTMSRMPGIGASWFKKYHADIFPDDFVIIEGKKCQTPKYYTLLLEKMDPSTHKEIKTKRINNMRQRAEENTWQRQETKATCKRLRVEKLVRNFGEFPT